MTHCKPIIPWIGGKKRISNEIMKRFPKHTCYVEPFAGGAAIFWAKEPAKVEVINDINGDLVNLYRVVKHHLEEFLRQFKWALASRQIYEWEKMSRGETLTDIQRAARFFYLQKLGFGGSVASHNFGTATTSRPRFNLLRLEEDLSQAHLRLASAYIEQMQWDKLIERYDRPHTLFYLDPPYWQTAGYGVPFEFDQYERMAQMAREAQGSVVISINDHPDIRRVFQGFRCQEVGIKYSSANGKPTPAKELIIWNQNCEEKKAQEGSP